MLARKKTAWWVAMIVAAHLCAAQQPQTGTVPESGATQGGIGPNGSIQKTPVSPETNKLAPENGDLTFLPPLTPTDGVPDLPPERSGAAEIASDTVKFDAKSTPLDRAVAVINGKVILESDVREQQLFAVFEPYSVPGGEFTRMQAMQQIVNRQLLLDQMAEQEFLEPPTDAEVDKQIEELRKHLPACAGKGCETEAGWRRFLAEHSFTMAELHARWKERMEILDFIGMRFRTGIRITKPEIESYYKEKLVPEFQARKLPPPPLAQVSDRIEDVLLQQHVNLLLTDYLASLKDAGSVQILDPQYNGLGNSSATNARNSPEIPGPTGRGGGEP